MPGDPFEDLDLADWVVYDTEPAGSKPDKVWVVPPDNGGERWLWKRRTEQRHHNGDRFWKGDDWAEKVATEVAGLLGVPVAPVEFAHRHGLFGIISGSVARDRTLALGNQVLSDRLPDYRGAEKTDLERYSLMTILDSLTAIGAVAPPAVGMSAGEVFAGYLVLDALVANTDRHHENWGVLVGRSGEPAVLAPSFDHASSLGFQLSDERRSAIIDNADGVADYAARGVSRHFRGSPSLLDLATAAVRQCDAVGWVDALRSVDNDTFGDVIDRIPDARMSPLARTFVVRLLAENRRRLLDEFDRPR